jgi:hypothetical protein
VLLRSTGIAGLTQSKAPPQKFRPFPRKKEMQLETSIRNQEKTAKKVDFLIQRIFSRLEKGPGPTTHPTFAKLRTFKVLACDVYVDPNSIWAALAETIEQSDYTSVQRRIAALKSNRPNLVESQTSDRVDRVDDFLSPVSIHERKDPIVAHPSSHNKRRCSDKGLLARAEADYLDILDWLVRNKVAGKRGSTPVEASAIVRRQSYLRFSDNYISPVDFGRVFKNVAGKSTSIEQARSLKKGRKFYRARV